MITASRSVPETPSTSAWCVLASMAQRPSSRPSTTQISQSGLERSSCCAITRPTSLRSSLSPPGDGQRGVAQVVLDVEVRVVDPDRTAQLEGDEADLLAVPRHQVELGVHHGDDVAERRRRTLEDRHRGDVHVGHVVLNVEERRIQRAQAISTHRPSLRGLPLQSRAYSRAAARSRVQPAVAAASGSPSDGELGGGENQLPGLLVGGLDHLGAPVLGHRSQPHGAAGFGPGLQADHDGAGLLASGRSRAPSDGARSDGSSRRRRWRCRGPPTWRR